jgi:hypothetical protein
VSQYQWWCVIFYNHHYPCTQTSSYYSLDHSSDYHNGLSHPFCCFTLVSVYTPLLMYVICFVLHILTLFQIVVYATPSIFIYSAETNCDICIKHFLTVICLLSRVDLYKNIAVDAKHYFELYHNVSCVLFSGIAQHIWSSIVKIILTLT